MEIDLVKLVENVRLHVPLRSPSLSMENLGLSRVKRSLRWTWLRLSTKRFLSGNGEAAAAGLTNPHQGLAAMLEEHDGADVTFTVGDRQFRADRRVLAAGSPVFAAELFGPMKETSTRHVEIDDMEPAIFEALLHFACTGALPDGADGVAPLQHLLVAADRYGMYRLMAACEWKLCQSIDVESVATTLALAEQHHRVKLKNACIGFVSTKSVLSAVRETEGFAHLVETCPLVMVDILEQKLPSSVTRFLTLCATQAHRSLILLGAQLRRGLSRFGTKVASSFRRLGNHVDLVQVGIVVGFFSTFGLLVFLIRKLEGDNASQDQRWPPTFSRLHIQQSLQELRSRIAQQQSPLPFSPIASLQGWLRRQDLSSWLPKVSSLARLQEFQESAWLNSDI
ncbi:uncharacterized protein LOC124671304 [Lolium rigidum]|uniref:uncharacterized protein LOC124671304 n=1 Tax=Lolium rigidum TaxID=89674 RepID=UPI001F5C8C3B|nr:uncharacterized protein LOC124671304 [Lolium rigidum]